MKHVKKRKEGSGKERKKSGGRRQEETSIHCFIHQKLATIIQN
jgi:hypothetical protein